MLKVTQKEGARVTARKSKRKMEDVAKQRDGLDYESYDYTAATMRIADNSLEAHDEEQRMLRAANDAAWEVIRKIHDRGASNHPLLSEIQVFTVVRLAAEAAAAKAAGYESWAAFEAARVTRVIGDLP